MTACVFDFFFLVMADDVFLQIQGYIGYKIRHIAFFVPSKKEKLPHFLRCSKYAFRLWDKRSLEMPSRAPVCQIGCRAGTEAALGLRQLSPRLLNLLA